MSLERKTPLKSVRAKPRRLPLFSCSRQRCTNPPRFFGWCSKHAKLEADKLFSKLIRTRDRYCQMCGTDYDLDCAHIFSRGYFSTRWDPANAVALCSGHHKEFTHRPIEWDDWCIERMGREAWDALRFKARRGGMPDVGLTITELRVALKEVAA